jgi:exodeoxyribonuclease VII small subunit
MPPKSSTSQDERAADQHEGDGSQQEGGPGQAGPGQGVSEQGDSGKKRSARSGKPGARHGESVASEEEAGDGVNDLSFRQARTALDLTLAQLQASDLEVEAMATLVRQAQRYADRCESVLHQVEQDVMQWDPQDPGSDPIPLS